MVGGVISGFIAGIISEASIAGFFFSIGIMLAGWAVHDVVTFAGGLIALVVVIFAIYTHKSSSD